MRSIRHIVAALRLPPRPRPRARGSTGSSESFLRSPPDAAAAGAASSEVVDPAGRRSPSRTRRSSSTFRTTSLPMRASTSPRSSSTRTTSSRTPPSNDGDLDANFSRPSPTRRAGGGERLRLHPGARASTSSCSRSTRTRSSPRRPLGRCDRRHHPDVMNQIAPQAPRGQLPVELPTDGRGRRMSTTGRSSRSPSPRVEGPRLVRSLDDVDIAVINGNFAREGGLSQVEDAKLLSSRSRTTRRPTSSWSTATEKADAIAKLEELSTPMR